MILTVPTFMCQAMFAVDCDTPGRKYKAGEIIEMAYGHALVLKAGGLVSGLVDEQMKHLEAQEQLAIYGGDCWFPMRQQSIGKVADYLSASNEETRTVN